MAINRSGRSLPAGPAMTPQASSGWSARACASICARRAALIVSMLRRLAERFDQAVLQVGQPLIDPDVRRPRITGRPALGQTLLFIGDPQPDAQRQPDVIQRLQPLLALGLAEHH